MLGGDAWFSSDVIWKEDQIKHMAGHGITVEMANEALDDVDAVEADPDPKSTSGKGIRRIGYSHTRRRVLTVIVARIDGELYGVNGWPSSTPDRRRYDQGA
ncbi:MAG TPA: hypothetical protein VFZ37_14975 [Jiangellaceae bacterium]